MFVHGSPNAANANELGAIHPEQLDRQFACFRESDELRMIVTPSEVLTPLVAARMKQRRFHRFTSMNTDNSIRLVAITCWTGEAQVAQLGGTIHGSGHDVLNFKDGDCQMLGGFAVGAARTCRRNSAGIYTLTDERPPHAFSKSGEHASSGYSAGPRGTEKVEFFGFVTIQRFVCISLKQ